MSKLLEGIGNAVQNANLAIEQYAAAEYLKQGCGGINRFNSGSVFCTVVSCGNGKNAAVIAEKTACGIWKKVAMYGAVGSNSLLIFADIYQQ